MRRWNEKIPPSAISALGGATHESMNTRDIGKEMYERTFRWCHNGVWHEWVIPILKKDYDCFRELPHIGRDIHQYSEADYKQYAESESDGSILEVIAKVIFGGNGWTKREAVENVLAFVQSIPYKSDKSSTGYEEYPRYPVETLVDGCGDCEDSAILAAALLAEMRYDVALLLLPGHAALGVAGKDLPGWSYTVNGVKYYFVETTSVSKIGNISKEFERVGANIFPIKRPLSLHSLSDHENSETAFYEQQLIELNKHYFENDKKMEDDEVVEDDEEMNGDDDEEDDFNENDGEDDGDDEDMNDNEEDMEEDEETDDVDEDEDFDEDEEDDLGNEDEEEDEDDGDDNFDEEDEE